MRQFWRMLLRNPGGLIGLVILVIAIAVAVFGGVGEVTRW